MVDRNMTSTLNDKIVIHDKTVYLSGQTGGDGTVADQMQECLRRVDGLLEEAGSSREHLLSAIIWLADMVDFDDMNEVWDKWVPEGYAPARACGAARLARPDLKVEVVVTAAVA